MQSTASICYTASAQQRNTSEYCKQKKNIKAVQVGEELSLANHLLLPVLKFLVNTGRSTQNASVTKTH